VTLRYGWHAAFLTTGVFSVFWILWWFRYYRRPKDHSTLTARELRHIYQDAAVEAGPLVPWRRLFSYRQTWAYSAAKFLTDPIWWFYLFWLPSYFGAKFNLNLSHLGLPLIIVYNVSVIGSIGGGWLPTPFRRLGLAPNHARLAAMLVCASLVVPIFTAASVKSLWIAIALIGVAAGAVVGIGGMAGSAGSTLFAFFAGHVLQPAHSYGVLFGIASSAYLVALIVLYLLAPGLKKVEFAA